MSLDVSGTEFTHLEMGEMVLQSYVFTPVVVCKSHEGVDRSQIALNPHLELRPILMKGDLHH